MCDRESFAKIRNEIMELQKAENVQRELLNSLFRTTNQSWREARRG
jgi:hypothetical protein